MAATDVHVDALETVTPATMADPGHPRRLAVAGALPPATLQTHFRVILYYKRTCEEESARTVAAWIKESLNVVLPEQPMLAGRLRRDSEAEGYWEVKQNDAGVRLVHASSETTLDEFLASKDGRESQLAYWQPIDGESPNFSALFSIQVTEFKADGYTVGISCSVLLADPLYLTKFLKRWVMAHNLMLAEGQIPKVPMCHLDFFQRPSRAARRSSTPQGSTTTTTSNTTTIIFKVVPRAPADYNALAVRCIEEASRKLEGRTVSEFSLLVSDHSGDLKVDSCNTKDGKMFDGELEVAWWDEFGMEEMSFFEGNKPIHVSYRVVSAVDQGLVVAMVPSSNEEGASPLVISVTVPQKI